MDSLLFSLLVCPECREDIAPPTTLDSVTSLSCACGASYPLIEGMPSMLPPSNRSANRTGEAFGRQWALQNARRFEDETIYGETAEEELQSFLDRFAISQPSQLDGKRILDIGCGSGRLTRELALYAPQATIVGGDLSPSAFLAHERCRGLPNVLVAQMDLNQPPLATSFDYVYADGVLPHVPDPDASLASLDRLLRPGGQLFIWIYPRSFSPYRLARDVLPRSDRYPPALQTALAWTLGVPLGAAFKLYEVARPERRRSLREVVFMLHDNLVPEFQHRFHPQEMVERFEQLGYVHVRALEPAVGVVGTKPLNG